jgi:hypothetical protein
VVAQIVKVDGGEKNARDHEHEEAWQPWWRIPAFLDVRKEPSASNDVISSFVAEAANCLPALVRKSRPADLMTGFNLGQRAPASFTLSPEY